MRTSILAGLALAALAHATAQAAPPPPPTTAPAFVMAASQSDEYERQAGMLAAQKGKDAKVRDFGQMMVTDHTMTSQNLRAAAMRDGMAPPPPPPPLRPDQMQMLATLRSASGDFDRAYIGQQVMAHQEALNVMRTYASGGDRPALKAAAAMTAPIVEHHLMMAQQMQASTR